MYIYMCVCVYVYIYIHIINTEQPTLTSSCQTLGWTIQLQHPHKCLLSVERRNPKDRGSCCKPAFLCHWCRKQPGSAELISSQLGFTEPSKHIKTSPFQLKALAVSLQQVLPSLYKQNPFTTSHHLIFPSKEPRSPWPWSSPCGCEPILLLRRRTGRRSNPPRCPRGSPPRIQGTEGLKMLHRWAHNFT
jgi:hypothetical protein